MIFSSFAVVDTFICVTMRHGYIACGLFVKKKRQMALMGYARALLPVLFDHVSVLTGQESIAIFIDDFAKRHRLSSVTISMAVSAPQMKEEFVFLSHATPDLCAFNFQKPIHLMWNYRYLFPVDDGQHCFYMAAISQQVLFQYKLLIIRNGWGVRMMTGYQASLLSLYEYIHHDAFRTIQFAQQMAAYNYDVSRLVGDMCIENFIIADQINRDNWVNEKEYIIALAGLFVATERSL